MGSQQHLPNHMIVYHDMPVHSLSGMIALSIMRFRANLPRSCSEADTSTWDLGRRGGCADAGAGDGLDQGS